MGMCFFGCCERERHDRAAASRVVQGCCKFMYYMHFYGGPVSFACSIVVISMRLLLQPYSHNRHTTSPVHRHPDPLPPRPPAAVSPNSSLGSQPPATAGYAVPSSRADTAAVS